MRQALVFLVFSTMLMLYPPVSDAGTDVRPRPLSATAIPHGDQLW